MYSPVGTHRAGSGAPFLLAVDPRDSPVFLHGRPATIDFDLAFTSTPYAKSVKQGGNSVIA